jgi:hypothetical protein
MINKVSTSKVFFMFLAFVVLFLPSALMMPAQASQISIVTSIGIDSSTEGIELSTTILVPKFESGFAKNTEVVSVNSENIAEGLHTMSVNLGKQIGLAHLSVIAISDEVFTTKNTAKLLKPLLLNEQANKNAVVISTNKSAKQLLQLSSTEDANSSNSLISMLELSENDLFKNKGSLQNFFINYNKPTSSSMLGIINAVEESVQGEDTQETNSENETDQPKKTLLSDGSIAIIKNGIKQTTLTKKQKQDLYWFTNKISGTTFTVKNVDDDVYNNKDVVLTVANSKIKPRTSFYNSIPRLNLNLKIQVSIENFSHNYALNNNQRLLTTELQRRIKLYIKQAMSRSFNYIKSTNTDIHNFYELFKAFNNQKFKAYLNLKNLDNYLDKLELFVSISLNSKN